MYELLVAVPGSTGINLEFDTIVGVAVCDIKALVAEDFNL
jgi:hypothetical protein